MKLKKTEFTMQEIWMHTKPKIQESKKVYKRKDKHKKKYK